MSKSKFDFLNLVLSKVQDSGKELQNTAIVSEVKVDGDNTSFTVDTVKNFTAGSQAFIYDGTTNFIKNIYSVNVTDKKIIVIGDLSSVQSGAVIIKTVAIQQLDESLSIYSRFNPLVKTKEYSGNETDTYSLPNDWLNNFSLINFIEYPVKEQPRAELKKEEYEVYLDADDNNYKIRFAFNIGAGEKFRINYTAPHTFGNDNTVTAPDGDFYCISNIGAYLYLIALASAFIQNVSSTLDADRINYQTKTSEARRMAKEYLTQAASHLGISIKNLEGSEIEPEGASISQGTEIRNKKIRIFS